MFFHVLNAKCKQFKNRTLAFLGQSCGMKLMKKHQTSDIPPVETSTCKPTTRNRYRCGTVAGAGSAQVDDSTPLGGGVQSVRCVLSLYRRRRQRQKSSFRFLKGLHAQLEQKHCAQGTSPSEVGIGQPPRPTRSNRQPE